MPLDLGRLRAALAGQAIGCEVEAHEELTSTSSHARDLGRAGHAHGLVVFAESQTAGRGRRDNRWSGAARQDLMFSTLLRPGSDAERFPRLATLAALGLARGVEAAGAFAPQIKWPNDLLLHGRKFCGVLAEMFAAPDGPFLVLGIGMNVNRASFPPELEGKATSLFLESGRKVMDRTALAIALLRALQSALESWNAGFGVVLEEVRRRSFLLGRRIRARVGGGTIEGVAHDLGPEGGLLVRRDDGVLLELNSADEVRVIEGVR